MSTAGSFSSLFLLDVIQYQKHMTEIEIMAHLKPRGVLNMQSKGEEGGKINKTTNPSNGGSRNRIIIKK